MKLRAFRIQNYRSIIDTNWKYLAYDNITVLIGQNESGKTSILEALKSFYEGVISDDILRSDLTYPIISCEFEIEKGDFLSYVKPELLPEQLQEKLKDKKEFIITRQWFPDKTNKVIADDIEIFEYFETKEKIREEIRNKTKKDIDALIKISDKLLKEMEIVEKEKNNATVKLAEKRKGLEAKKKAFTKAKKQDIKFIAQKDYETAIAAYDIQQDELHKKLTVFEDIKNKSQEYTEKVTISQEFIDITNRITAIEEKLKNAEAELKDAEHLYEISTFDKEKRNAAYRLEQAKIELSEIKTQSINLRKDYSVKLCVASKIFEGKNYRESESEALYEIEIEKKMHDPEKIGLELFNFIPLFEFFEDFSSLLPNKIDLEDVLAENHHTEGYKAAKNFLIIAGLNAQFFREKNHRILKQKIENLNGEITINFQDYWSQNVGKNDKINLNFELEHYDYTNPQKSGKPYLEFWIKDKMERLYPKQRSRGVRWFLSFYLELKATAKLNNRNRVLLIDEPGLSLHAKAQEDVLKVFEDLNKDMQIIYCTHSPHLIDVDKLYRILAVQRADENDETSETFILDQKSLQSASTDTLSPIYSLMGVRLNQQQFVYAKNNIIIEDTITYYYLNVILKLLKPDKQIHFIPATNVLHVPVLANILTGWRIEFFMLLFDNDDSKKVISELENSLFLNNAEEIKKHIYKLEKVEKVEDMFSTIDFKNHILHKRVGITDHNSEYIQNNEISRTILASEFITYIQNKKIKFSDFDELTQINFKKLFDGLSKMLD